MLNHVSQIWNLVPWPQGELGWIKLWNSAIDCTTTFLRILISVHNELTQATVHLDSNPFNVVLLDQTAQFHQELKIAEIYEAKGAQIKELFQRLMYPRHAI